MDSLTPYIEVIAQVVEVSGEAIDVAENVSYRVVANTPEVVFDQAGIAPYNRVHPKAEVHAARVGDRLKLIVNRADHGDFMAVFWTERETLRDCDGSLIME